METTALLLARKKKKISPHLTINRIVVLTNFYNQKIICLKNNNSNNMPVMKELEAQRVLKHLKEDAFIILFASDYVNCRYRVEGRKAAES